MNVLEVMITYYNTSKKDDIFHEVIGHILKNLDKVENSTIYDLAEICYVSTTTISRLCRKLNYKSFSSFKSELVNVMENYDYFNRHLPFNKVKKNESAVDIFLEELYRGISELQQMDKKYIEEVADAIRKHKKIAIYSYGPFGPTLNFQTDLVFAGHEIISSNGKDQIDNVESLDSDSMAIFMFPAIKEANYLVKVMKKVKECNSKILLITSTLNDFFVDYSDYSYCFDGSLTHLDRYRMEMFLSLVSITYRTKYID
jgi:DNA-binding MurR/RpiR family transcriptional regulator